MRAFGWTMLAVAATAGAADVPASAPAAPRGMRAYADPRTGALRDTPAPGEPPPPPVAATSRSGAGLVPTRAPGGGIMVDLQGRFQSPLVATVAPDGTVHIDHAAPGE